MAETFNLIIDGGYLSFVLGASPYTFDTFMHSEPYQQYVWVMDGKDNIRKQEFNDYKSSRSGKNMDVRERVLQVRNHVKNNYPYVVYSDYLEGDDLIALAHYSFPNTKWVTIANDKDMLQVPHMYMLGSNPQGDLKHVTVDNFKAAKSISDWLQRPQDLLFYQSLFGDTVDDIPRLLPLRRYDIMMDLMESETPFMNAYEMYGEQYVMNLKLVILPHPEVFHTFNKEDWLKNLDRWFREETESWFTGNHIKEKIMVKTLYMQRNAVISMTPFTRMLFQQMADMTGGINFIEKLLCEHRF